MTLEASIAALTAAIEANTAALTGRAATDAPSPAAEPAAAAPAKTSAPQPSAQKPPAAPRGRPPKAAAPATTAPSVTLKQLQEAAKALLNARPTDGKGVLIQILKDVGASKLSEIAADKQPEALAALEAAALE